MKKLIQSEVVMRFLELSPQRQMHIFVRLHLLDSMPTKKMQAGRAALHDVGEFVNRQIERHSDLLHELNAEIDHVLGVTR